MSDPVADVMAERAARVNTLLRNELGDAFDYLLIMQHTDTATMATASNLTLSSSLGMCRDALDCLTDGADVYEHPGEVLS